MNNYLKVEKQEDDKVLLTVSQGYNGELQTVILLDKEEATEFAYELLNSVADINKTKVFIGWDNEKEETKNKDEKEQSE